VPVGYTSVKVKGTALLTNTTSSENFIWDAIDVVNPPTEMNALFVTTNFFITTNQHRGICAGSDPEEFCNKTCVQYKHTPNGIETGNCSTDSPLFCDVYAWCPIEPAHPIGNNVIKDVVNFTVFVKNSVRFPKWGIVRDNVPAVDPVPDINLFTVGQMINRSGNGNSFDQLSTKGGVVVVQIDWTCNFDRDPNACQPNYKFVRIDDPESNSKGYNYRYAYYQIDASGRKMRDLYKLFGIRFIFLVSGNGGKFDIGVLLLNLGSGLALLGAATIISDFIMIYMLPKKQYYGHAKYDNIEDDNDLGLGQSIKNLVHKNNYKSVDESTPINRND